MKHKNLLTIIHSLSVAVILCFYFETPNIHGQELSPAAQSIQFEKQAKIAYESKDFAAYLGHMTHAEALRPNHPRLLYNLASANALNGNLTESLNLLRRIALMGLNFHPEKDADFSKVRTLPDFQRILKSFEKNRQPGNQSILALTLSEKDLIAESIAYDPKMKRFFIGSVHKKKIVVVENDGAIGDFSAPTDGLWSVLGIRIDEKRRLLWACTAALPQMVGFLPEYKGRSGILKYNLDTGKLLKRYILETPGNHQLGDLTLSLEGDVFGTDTRSPAIYRVTAATDAIETFLTDPSFVSLQGITFSPDGNTMFLADYSQGIRIDIKSKKVTLLSVARNVTTLGIDGLYTYGRKLLAIQNGITPNRVIEFNLNSDSTLVTGFKILDANHPDFAEPTLDYRQRLLVANSQWEAVNQKGEITRPENLRAPVILRLPL